LGASNFLSQELDFKTGWAFGFPRAEEKKGKENFPFFKPGFPQKGLGPLRSCGDLSRVEKFHYWGRLFNI